MIMLQLSDCAADLLRRTLLDIIAGENGVATGELTLLERLKEKIADYERPQCGGCAATAMALESFEAAFLNLMNETEDLSLFEISTLTRIADDIEQAQRARAPAIEVSRALHS